MDDRAFGSRDFEQSQIKGIKEVMQTNDEYHQEFCPRFASTPQRTQTTNTSPIKSPSYGVAFSSPRIKSLVDTLSPFSIGPHHYSHNDLLDVIEATEKASNFPTAASTPLPEVDSNKFTCINIIPEHMLSRYKSSSACGISCSAPCSSGFPEQEGYHVHQVTSPLQWPPFQQTNLQCSFNSNSRNQNTLNPINTSNQRYPSPIDYNECKGLTALNFWSKDEDELQFPAGSLGSPSLFQVPNKTKDKNLNEATDLKPTFLVPKVRPSPSKNVISDSPLKIFIKDGKKKYWWSKTKKNSGGGSNPNKKVISDDIGKRAMVESKLFANDFQEPDENRDRKPLAEIQFKVKFDKSIDKDKASTFPSSLLMSPTLSLKDLPRYKTKDSSLDSGYNSTQLSKDFESSKSRDDWSSSSGEFVSENGIPKEPIMIQPLKGEPNSCIKIEKSCTPLPTEQENNAKVAKGEIQQTPEDLELCCSPSPPISSGKVLRKPLTPIRSASPVDPQFRGVTLQMRTKLQKNNDVQLKIEGFFSCKKSNTAPVKKRSGPQESIHALPTRTRTTSTSSSGSEDPEQSPERKIRRNGHAGKQCASCGTKTTPLWRDAEDGTPLCNACGIRYKKYRVRCTRCWHIPRKETKVNLHCTNCGEVLKVSVIRSKQWKC